MSARKHARRIVNRRRAKNVATLRELQEVNEWLLAVKEVTTPAPKQEDWSRHG